jgi:hypothetical protein
MYRIILLAFVAVLAACSVAPRTPMQGAYDVTSSYGVVAKTANAYIAMPRCSAVVHQPCSDQGTVNAIKAADNKAYAAVQNTQQVAKGASVSGSDQDRAVAAANAAITAFQTSVPATAKE